MSESLSQTIVLGIFAAIGGVVILLSLHTLLYGIYARLIRPAKNIVKKFGQWGWLFESLIIIFYHNYLSFHFFAKYFTLRKCFLHFILVILCCMLYVHVRL